MTGAPLSGVPLQGHHARPQLGEKKRGGSGNNNAKVKLRQPSRYQVYLPSWDRSTEPAALLSLIRELLRRKPRVGRRKKRVVCSNRRLVA